MGGNQQNSQRDQQPGEVNVSETQSFPAFNLPNPSGTSHLMSQVQNILIGRNRPAHTR
jgi:hypothetical protein